MRGAAEYVPNVTATQQHMQIPMWPPTTRWRPREYQDRVVLVLLVSTSAQQTAVHENKDRQQHVHLIGHTPVKWRFQSRTRGSKAGKIAGMAEKGSAADDVLLLHVPEPRVGYDVAVARHLRWLSNAPHLNAESIDQPWCCVGVLHGKCARAGTPANTPSSLLSVHPKLWGAVRCIYWTPAQQADQYQTRSHR